MIDMNGFIKKSMPFKGTLVQIAQQQQLINDSEKSTTEYTLIYPLNQISEHSAVLSDDGVIEGDIQKSPLYEAIIGYKVKAESLKVPVTATSKDLKGQNDKEMSQPVEKIEIVL